MNAKVKNIPQKVIDTGLVEFKLPFDRGEEKIYFNPNDTEFFLRLSEMIDNISELYENAGEEFEATEDNKEKLEIIRRLNGKVKEEFDNAFGNSVADTIFKYVSPHGIIKSKSQYFAFYILEYLMPLIEKETGETAEKANKALEKAMKKHNVKYK